MTEIEKLQEQHRLEAARMRAKVKARKLRTRRLIQHGAILENELGKIWPVEHMADERLETFLRKVFADPSCKEILEAGEDKTSPLFQGRMAHLYTLRVPCCTTSGGFHKSQEVSRPWRYFI